MMEGAGETLALPHAQETVGRAVPARRSKGCRRMPPEMCGRMFSVLRGISWKHPWNPANARRKKGGRTRPLREGGGAAMKGRRTHGKREAAGAAAGGVLRPAVAAITTSRRQQATQALCGWTMRKPSSPATRRTPPRRPFLPLRTRNPQAIFLRAAPPSRRGANARALSILRISLHNHSAILPVRWNFRRTMFSRVLSESHPSSFRGEELAALRTRLRTNGNPVFCTLRLAGRGRPPGGPSWGILPHGPPGGRARRERTTRNRKVSLGNSIR